MSSSYPNYSALLNSLRATELLVHDFASKEPMLPALGVLQSALAESIAQFETLSTLSDAIEGTRPMVEDRGPEI